MTCYEPGRSKTLFFGLNLKGGKFLEALNLWVRCRKRFFFHKKRSPYFWKPLACGYVAAGAFFSPEKRVPYFWKPLACGYVAAGAFFSQKTGPHISGSPPEPHSTDPPDLGTDHEGTARKSAASRQGRNGRVFNKARNIGICGI